MKYSKEIYILIALIFSPLIISAQNFNPVVDVTNEYQAKQIKATKALMAMSVPDSLMDLNYHFDYSIFNNQYKGAYVFSPYVIDIKPLPRQNRQSQLYLKAGLSYHFKPLLSLVYSPRFKQRNFALNLYAFHNSSWARYRNVYPIDNAKGLYNLFTYSQNNRANAFPLNKVHFGYYSSTRLGFNSRYDTKKNIYTADVAYIGLHSRDSSIRSLYNGLEARFGLVSREKYNSDFNYALSLLFNYGADRIKNLHNPESRYTSLSNTDLQLDFSLAKALRIKKSKIANYFKSFFVLDAYYALSRLEPIYNKNALYFIPKYRLINDKWDINLGLKLSGIFTDTSTKQEQEALTAGQIIYPDINISYRISKLNLNLYSSITGGDEMNTYWKYKKEHFLYHPEINIDDSPYIQNSLTRADFRFGFKGSIFSRFSYNNYIGYKIKHNASLDLIRKFTGDYYTYGHSYEDYNSFYIAGQYKAQFSSFIAEANIMYRNIDLSDKFVGFEPAAFTANMGLKYSIRNRIYLAMLLDCASSRYGYIQVSAKDRLKAYIPSYYDLSFNAEYKFTRKLSFWTSIDNILNQDIQRIPLYPDTGISFHLGICLNM